MRQGEEGGFGETSATLQQRQTRFGVASNVERQKRNVHLILRLRLLRNRVQSGLISRAGDQEQRQREVASTLRTLLRDVDATLLDAEVCQTSPALRVVRVAAVVLGERALEKLTAGLEINTVSKTHIDIPQLESKVKAQLLVAG